MTTPKLLFALWLGFAAGLLEAAVKAAYHGLPGDYGALFTYLLSSGLVYGCLLMILTLLLSGWIRYEWILGAAAAGLVLIELTCYYIWHRFELMPLAGGRGLLLFKAAAAGAALAAGAAVYFLFRAAGLSQRIARRKKLLVWMLVPTLALPALVPFLLSPGGAGAVAESAEAPQPNLLLLTIDTLRSDCLGCYGHPAVSTPAIDGLAGESALFLDAVCEMPLTTPSHAAVLSSTYPATNKALGNQYLFKEGFSTLSQILNRRRGYRCAAFISGFPLDRRFGLSRGFHVYDDRFFRHTGIWRNSLLQILARFKSGGAIERRADDTTNAALEWLRANREGRFFLWIHYFDPHAPYEAPPPFDEMYRNTLPVRPAVSAEEKNSIFRALGRKGGAAEAGPDNLNRPVEQYLGEISYVDHQIARIFSLLRDAGLWHDTLVVFTSDHGESLTEHDYLFQHGEFLYEPSVSVPLIIKRPGGAAGGLRIEESVQLIDIAPTVLGVLGIQPPSTFQGRDLLPLMSGRNAGSAGRPAFIENTDRTPQYRPRKLRAVRTKHWKYIFSPDDGAAEIYNLADDPGETVNLAGQADEMGARLKAWMDRWPEVTGGGSGRAKEILLDEETGRKLKELGYVSE
jgi:arylsulfatase A-like enzyme